MVPVFLLKVYYNMDCTAGGVLLNRRGHATTVSNFGRVHYELFAVFHSASRASFNPLLLGQMVFLNWKDLPRS